MNKYEEQSYLGHGKVKKPLSSSKNNQVGSESRYRDEFMQSKFQNIEHIKVSIQDLNNNMKDLKDTLLSLLNAKPLEIPEKTSLLVKEFDRQANQLPLMKGLVETVASKSWNDIAKSQFIELLKLK
jgi:hypothetical protein